MLEKNQRIQLEKDSYTLIKLIGEGGQGVIWQVKADATGEQCVLKTIRTHETSRAGRPQPLMTEVLNALRWRMQEEIDFFLSIQNKQHCFIARCLDHGVITSDQIDLPVMIMPFYAGGNLQDQMPYGDQQPTYDLPTVLKWLVQLSQALACTHEQTINGQAYMHRDIKPANILLTENGDVRLIDFGIAKQQGDDSGTTSIAHSPAWAAPEQMLPDYVRDSGDNVFRLTEKTDMYGLGLTAYYLCTGGSQSTAQSELSQRTQVIYNQHVHLLYEGKEGKLGKVGGLYDKDGDYLQQKLLAFIDHPSSFFSHVIGEQMIVLVKQLLSPKATERPTAEDAKQQFQFLQQALSPRLEHFSVRAVNKDVLLGKGLELDLELGGQGLIRPFDWLQIIDQDKTTYSPEVVSVSSQQAVFLPDICYVRLRLTPFAMTGHYHLQVTAQVDTTQQQKIECVVNATAEQLWEQGLREEALNMEVREKWLDILEKEARGSTTANYKYLQLLKNLEHSTQDEKIKAHLVTRYTRIEAPELPVWRKLAMIITGMVLLGGLLWVFVLNKEDTVVTQQPIDNIPEPEKQVVKDADVATKEIATKETPLKQEEAPLPTADEKTFAFEPEMTAIPAGSFPMGCVSGKSCNKDEKPVRIVTLKAFEMAKTEVTFDQWDTCVKDKGCTNKPQDHGWGRGQRPVLGINWNDAQQYVKWLNKKTNKNYRLPTEAEWEYAARADSKTKYSFGNNEADLCNYANHAASNSTGYSWRNKQCSDGISTGTAIVASYRPNKWGLYDMHGNVWEWTCSTYTSKYDGSQNECNNSNPVLRGGSWHCQAKNLRLWTRGKVQDKARVNLGNNTGFRVVRTL